MKELILEAKGKHINDPRQIASWIFNTKGYKKLGLKQVKKLVNAELNA